MAVASDVEQTTCYLTYAKQTSRQSSLWKHYISVIILIVAVVICKTNFGTSVFEDLDKNSVLYLNILFNNLTLFTF